MLQKPLQLEGDVTTENFNEESYLLANADVAAAVRNGTFPSGRSHFDASGYREKRRFRVNSNQLAHLRATKIDRLRPHLRTDMPCIERDGRLDYLSDELRIATRIIDTERVSANGYDRDTLDLIEKHQDGFVLDCGAGRRDFYHSNVLNFEIVAYDTTDVIGVGEALPFEDGTFDAVLSIAVLEHVRDPFLCANEIIRVLKPGGDLFCAVPFLQPMHGYPHHYFNATKQGIARLFEDDLTVDRVYIPAVGHPAYALHWFLESWERGLEGQARAAFGDLTIGELIERGPGVLASSLVGQLPEAQMDELACGFVVRARKP
jgi:SAM-dependent methyltransferase